MHSVTKSLQIWVLGAEHKLEGPRTPSCRRGDGKAVMRQQGPTKVQDGCDPHRSHQAWKGRDMSQGLSLGGGIARHLGITSKGNTHCLGVLSPLKGEETVGMMVNHTMSLLIRGSNISLH